MTSSSPAPVVSVVVVCYQARDHVLACLSSLQRNVRMPHEAIVVDDGSADGTAEAVAEHFPAARILAKHGNQGLVAGRNDGLRLVRGRLVLMLDADTEVRPGAVEALASVLDEHPEVGLVSPKLLYPDGRLQLSCRRYPPLLLPLLRRGPYARLNPDPAPHRWHLMYDCDHEHRRPVVWTAGAAQMYRSELPTRIGPYDRRVSSYGGEDCDWCLRTLEAGLEVWYVPDAVIVHVFQQVTRQNPFGRKSRRALRDFYYLQWKHRRIRKSALVQAANQ